MMNQITNEAEFRDQLLLRLSGKLGADYEAVKGGQLLYNVVVHPESGRYVPVPIDRGLPDGKPTFFAFQTDILVKKLKQSPRLVLELKWAADEKPGDESSGYNTDAIITYSAKARRHKQIYPYLRYGLVLGNRAKLGQKFFVHNTGFDFAFAMTLHDGMLLAWIIHEIADREKKRLHRMGGDGIGAGKRVEGGRLRARKANQGRLRGGCRLGSGFGGSRPGVRRSSRGGKRA